MKYFGCLTGILVLFPLPAVSQVVADDSSATKVITSDRLNFAVKEGSRSGNNLFHSFESFSIPTNGSVLFDNATDIENIFSRVTGGSISQIDGLIQTLGEANLFLLNPNGIIFGNNASLDVGGSFIVSTAEAIQFADGTLFSAMDTSSEPLLTVSIPLGLQYGSNPGAIKVIGTGQQILNNTDPLYLSLLNKTDGTANLEVAPEKTLALIGGDVSLQGSSLKADRGRIELGGVSSGTVGLQATALGWQLDYGAVNLDRDVQLSSFSAIDASGITSQGIQLAGKQIKLSDGSIVTLQVSQTSPKANIEVIATELVQISGTDPTALLRSNIAVESSDLGSANLTLTSPKLVIEDGAGITSFQQGINRGGNLKIDVSDEIIVRGFAFANSDRFSTLGIFNLGDGDGGNVNISTHKLQVLDGANIGSVTVFGTGTGGNVNINATESIEVKGRIPRAGSFSSTINASTIGNGDGGRIILNTGKLRLVDGGDIDSNTLASGDAGEIIVNASESIEIIDTFESNELNISGINSSSIANVIELQVPLNLPLIPAGNGSKVTINTPYLSANGLLNNISAVSQGTGEAGNIEINAETVSFTNNSRILATTLSGEGGNINIVADLLFLKNSSLISARAENQGNGGNIEIDSDLVVLLENSQINANAFEGNGGNVTIDTQGFFRSLNSEIDASSRLGIDGIVTVNRLDRKLIPELEELPTEAIDPNLLVTLSCAIDRENSFIVTGKGGLSVSEKEVFNSNGFWQDWRIPEPELIERSHVVIPRKLKTNIVEARGWKVNQRGNIVLTGESNQAVNSSQFWSQSSSCS